MDVQTLLQDAKARFNHNSAKAYLHDKYKNKLIIADQGGLWLADIQTLTFLASYPNDFVVLIDTFNNPIKVNSKELYKKLFDTYESVMNEWHDEWKELENKR